MVVRLTLETMVNGAVSTAIVPAMDEPDGVDELDGLENLDPLSPKEQDLLRELIRADRKRQEDQPPVPSPISAFAYPPGAYEQWHWVACDEPDRALSAFVGEFVAADPERQRQLRDCLTHDDYYTVLLFAHRRAFASIRNCDPALAVEAFDAMSIVDSERIDYRDATRPAWLAGLAASRAGLSVAEATAGAIARAIGSARGAMLAVVSRAGEDLERASAVQVVNSADGPVLVGRTGHHYRPDLDLARLALDVAHAVDADGTYHIERVEIATQLPPVWLRDPETPHVVTALDHATGAALVAGVPSPGAGVDPNKQHLLVWLCEFRTEADASHIRDAVERRDADRVVCAVRSGRLCAVIIMASTWVRTKAFAPPEAVARVTEIVASSIR
jgi:hypothetical protein